MEPVKQQILVVDDNLKNIQVIGPLLRDAGYQVSVAMSAAKGLASIKVKRPNLIISDLRMPEMDGFEFCIVLKEDIDTKDIPLIFLTASDDWEDETRGLSLGAVDFIYKPINPPILLARVKTHLKLQQALHEIQKRNLLLEENAVLRDDVERMSRHDLKSPLHGIISAPELLRLDNNLTGDQLEMLQIIEDSAYRMLGMINSSLDLYKMEVGSYRLKSVPVSILSILNKVYVSLHIVVAANKVKLSDPVFIGCSEEDSFVMGEELLLFSLFSNLIKNGIEASFIDTEVSVSLTKKFDDIVIKITNSGEVPEQIRHIFFEKYSTSGKSDGTGLGTYSAMLITRTLKGDIELDCSVPGETSICVYLPAVS